MARRPKLRERVAERQARERGEIVDGPGAGEQALMWISRIGNIVSLVSIAMLAYVALQTATDGVSDWGNVIPWMIGFIAGRVMKTGADLLLKRRN